MVLCGSDWVGGFFIETEKSQVMRYSVGRNVKGVKEMKCGNLPVCHNRAPPRPIRGKNFSSPRRDIY
jgi:hypothetical protein